MATSVTVTEEYQDDIALRTIRAVDRDNSASLGARRSEDAPAVQQGPPKLHPVILTAQLAGVNLLSSVINGYITVGLPRITSDLKVPEELFFWPSSVYGLTIASTLLLAGSVADILGTRAVDLVGCFTLAVSILGSGFVRNGVQFIVLRVIQGIAMSLHLSSSVAIVAGNLPQGRSRNIAFSCIGLSQPLGFSLGLVLGGILIDTIGWRAGWFIDGGAMLLLFAIGLRILPRSKRNAQHIMTQLATKVDWIGATIASAFFACLSYLLAIISTDVYRIRDTETIVLLAVATAALPAFLSWVHYRVKVGKTALMPNKLWKNMAFSTICLTIMISFGVLNSMEQFSSLFFQEVQQLSALQASIRILPSLIVGVALNFSTGLVVDKISAVWLVVGSSVLCAIAPLLMALLQPQWPYWYNAFFAQILMPISGDVLFTVGLIVVSNVFPEDTQSLAGAVFNTAAQFGSSLGLTVMQVVSTLTAKGEPGAAGSPEKLMAGYRATFWAMFALMVSCAFVGIFGLRRAGKYVEKLTPTSGVNKTFPIVFISAGIPAGNVWLNTPDNREGWAAYFLEKGYQVYIVDITANGRSGQNDISKYPLRLGSTVSIHENGFTAPENLNAYPQSQGHDKWPGNGTKGDPVFDAFFASTVPLTSNSTTQELSMRAAGCKLLSLIGQSFLVGHSAAATYSALMSDECPEMVRATINLEPGNIPFQSLIGNSTVPSVGRTRSRPWGLTNTAITYEPPVVNVTEDLVAVEVGQDLPGLRSCFLQSNGTVARSLPQIAKVPYVMFTAANSPHITYDHCFVLYLHQAGVEDVKWVKLGDQGLVGNGHFFFLEENNLELAAIVEEEITIRS